MPRFRYRAIGPNKKVVNKVISAADYAEAHHLIIISGMEPVKITQIGVQDTTGTLKKLTLKEVTIFCRQFGTMISAGIPLIRIFEILREQAVKEKQKNNYGIYEKIYDSIQKGYSLNECMAELGSVFPAMLVNMVRAGEVSGSLDRVIGKMADYYDAQNKLINRVKTGLMYPKILIAMVIVIVLGLFGFILPKFFVVFDELDIVLPKLTLIVIAMSDFVKDKWYVLLIIGLSGVLAFSIAMTNESFAYFVDMAKTKIPKVREAVEKMAIANFTSTMGVLYSSGVPMLQSLEIAAAVLDNRFYHDKLSQVIIEVEAGKMLSIALAEAQIFEPMVTSLMRIGEESGNLEEIFFKAADFYAAEAEEAVARMVAVIEPIIIIFIGIVVLIVVAAVLLPSFSMASQVTEKANSGAEY